MTVKPGVLEDVETVEDEENAEDEDGQQGKEGQEGAGGEHDAEGKAGVEGEEGQEKKEGTDGEEETQEEDPRDQKIAELEERLAQIEGKKVTEEKPKPQERTQEEWDDIVEKTGIPKEAINYFEGGLASLGRLLLAHIDQRLGGSDKERTLDAMSKEKGFTDIKKYVPLIDEFLQDYPVNQHKDRKLIEKGYYFALGRSSKGDIKKVQASKDGVRKIITKISPSRKVMTGGKKGSTVKLSDDERALAKAAGMTEQQYLEGKTLPLSEIAI